MNSHWLLQILIKFGKSLKVFRKILLKWLGKTAKYCLNFISFRSCTEKWPKVGQTLSITLTKVYGIQRRFSQSETFGFNKISSCFVLFMTKIFCFTHTSQLPTKAWPKHELLFNQQTGFRLWKREILMRIPPFTNLSDVNIRFLRSEPRQSGIDGFDDRLSVVAPQRINP
jgi:hypothetical protein